MDRRDRGETPPGRTPADQDLLLPTFFTIGAGKCGTTALHAYLARHPEIAMTDPKEPHVMIGTDFRARAAWYPDLFAEERPLRGESSTGYSVAPFQAEVPGNIAALVPTARLIYLVRDPVERSIAHHAQEVIALREQRPIEVALDPEDPACQYVAGSCYASQLDNYLDHFDREQVLVLSADRLRGDRETALRTVLEHIGADPGFSDPAWSREHNVRSADNLRLQPGARKFTQGRLGRAYTQALPESLRIRITPGLRRLLGGREVRPEVPPALREHLAERLRPEAERLRGMTGQDFEGWSV